MENAAAILCAPTSVSVTVRRPSRPREYLTEREIEKLIKAAGGQPLGSSGRHSYPDRLSPRPTRQRACGPALG